MDDLTRARLLVGVDLLLTNPEALGNDALEGDLYLLRDRLQTQRRPEEASIELAARAAGPGGRSVGPAARAGHPE
jgi:hypothetical protein